MATAGLPLAPYDDGSSTESEYYYDPTDEGEAAAADAWEHENPVQETPHSQESTVIKLEHSDNERLQQVTEDIALPEGSEWSHGSVATVYASVVEQALAMARELADTQREPSTDDTINDKATELEEGEEVESKVVSLKSVKSSTPPASITRSVATGLRNPPSEVAVPVEMEGELSVARPQWKAGQKSPREKTTQDNTKHKDKTSLQQVKSSSRRESASNWRTEHSTSSRGRSTSIHPRNCSRPPSPRRRTRSRSPSPRRRTRSRSPSPRRRTRSRSPVRRHRSRSPPVRQRNSPPRHRVEYDNRRERYSPPKHYSRRSRSRTRSRSPSRRRSRSRSPSRRSFSSGRYISDERRALSPRHHYDSERRGYRRSRSPSSPRAYHSTHDRFRSRSRERSRGRSDHRLDFGYDHKDSYERNTHRPSPRRPADHDPQHTQYQTRDQYSWNNKEDYFPSQRGHGPEERSGGLSVQRNASRSTSRPRPQEPVPQRPILHSVAIPSVNPTTIQTSTKSPRDPRVRPRVAASEASHGQDYPKNKPGFVYYSPFERRVFKLKLQEADVDEAAARGFWTGPEKSFYERRRQNIAEDRAKLMMENLELFEQVYNSTCVTSADIERYQADRSFASRVAKFKRKQEALQEQKNLFLSTEKQDELWRQLASEREALIAKNSVMFHKVMKDSVEPLGQYNDRAPNSSNTQHNGKPSHGGSGGNAYDSQPHIRRTMQMHRRRESATFSISSRVVAGAALQLSSTNGRDDFKIPPAVAGNTTWY